MWETKLEKKRDAIKKVKRIDYIILWVIVGLFLLEMIAMPKFITAGNVIGLFYLTIAGYIRKLNAKIRDGKNCPVVKEQENRDVESGSKIEGGNGE